MAAFGGQRDCKLRRQGSASAAVGENRFSRRWVGYIYWSPASPLERFPKVSPGQLTRLHCSPTNARRCAPNRLHVR